MKVVKKEEEEEERDLFDVGVCLWWGGGYAFQGENTRNIA